MKKNLKKQILLGLVLMMSLNGFSYEHLKLTHIKIKPNSGEGTEWIQCNPKPIDGYFKKNLIIINSDTRLIIKHGKLIKTQHENYYTLTGVGCDNMNRTLGVKRIIFNNGSSKLVLTYGDGKIIYFMN
jgi:hypothetical protein